MKRIIYIPPWVYRGIRPNDVGYKKNSIGGFDTETYRGLPMTMQFHGPTIQRVIPVTEKNIFERFLLVVSTLPDNSVFYAHNLEHDLAMALYPFRAAMLEHSKFELTGPGFHALVFYGKRNALFITYRGKMFSLIDSAAFFQAPLRELAQKFGLKDKLPKPAQLGDRWYSPRCDGWKNFHDYALRDAEIERGLGEHIEEIHRKFDLSQTMSAPQLSARVFRHHFVTTPIPALNEAQSNFAYASYHGGKNALYVAPGIYPRIKMYDINSAYPFAFTQLPNFAGARYRWTEPTDGSLRSGAILTVDGSVNHNPREILRDENFQPVNGAICNLHITSYEYGAFHRLGGTALRRGIALGILPNKRVSNPLCRFAEEFFARKQSASGAEREFYKIILNSLYGKFVQSTENEIGGHWYVEGGQIKHRDEFVAGSMWNPFLGSLITGYVRAHLAGLEWKYNALHSSTDSIMVGGIAPQGNALGDLSKVCEGTALLLRPKLYVIWNPRTGEVLHYALHGFHGSLASLVRMVRSGKRVYFHQRMRKLKESARQRVQPFVMVKMFKRINLEIQGPLKIPTLYLNGKKI